MVQKIGKCPLCEKDLQQFVLKAVLIRLCVRMHHVRDDQDEIQAIGMLASHYDNGEIVLGFIDGSLVVDESSSKDAHYNLRCHTAQVL